MNHSDQQRAADLGSSRDRLRLEQREHNASALFGWIAAATTLLVAFLFLMFSAPTDRVANDTNMNASGKPATTGQSNTK